MERAGLAYMLGGSFSSNLYGIPRSTKDADFVVEFGSQSSELLRPFLGNNFIIEPQMSFETITCTYRYILRHRLMPFKVELFELSDDPHDRERFARRRHGVLMNKKVFVPAPEDVVITKLRWSKGGARQKDVEDVRNVLAVTGSSNLDLPYIRHWCDQHGTRELFEQLLADAQA